MQTIKITHGNLTAMMEWDGAQASAPIMLDGSPTQYQTADARHRMDMAVALMCRIAWPEERWPDVANDDGWDGEAWEDVGYEPALSAAEIARIPYDIRSRSDDGAKYYTAIDHEGHEEEDAGTCEECAAELAKINAALPTGWGASWTGNGNGTESDVVISFVSEVA